MTELETDTLSEQDRETTVTDQTSSTKSYGSGLVSETNTNINSMTSDLPDETIGSGRNDLEGKHLGLSFTYILHLHIVCIHV